MSSDILASGPSDGMPVLYFHGAASTRDPGPPDDICERHGVRLLRHVRPGYDSTPRARGGLVDVAAAAVGQARALTDRPLVVVGWSGGGPYALAAAMAGGDVRAVGLLAAWAPMNPPHPGLPLGVRAFMRVGRRAPRATLRTLLFAAGYRNPGHADDVHRVARPWGFAISDVTARVPVVAWHGALDASVPIEPWRAQPTVRLHALPTADHQPTPEVWHAVMSWATAR